MYRFSILIVILFGSVSITQAADTLTNVELLQFDNALVRTSDMERVTVAELPSEVRVCGDGGCRHEFPISLDHPAERDFTVYYTDGYSEVESVAVSEGDSMFYIDITPTDELQSDLREGGEPSVRLKSEPDVRSDQLSGEIEVVFKNEDEPSRVAVVGEIPIRAKEKSPDTLAANEGPCTYSPDDFPAGVTDISVIDDAIPQVAGSVTCFKDTRWVDIQNPWWDDILVYDTGYRPTPQGWQEVSLSGGGNEKKGPWLRGGATVTLPPLAAGEIDVLLVYSCVLVNGEWKCGCKDSTCARSHWQALYSKGIEE
ncbi:hypothetical protein GVX82_04655 [Patescibacteria group bacterium]|jgi:hypothetical protein|nr:hypothetical protein [Patescibacteria group bacterium]